MASLPPAQLNIGPVLLPDFITSAFFHCILAWPTLAEAIRRATQVSLIVTPAATGDLM